VRRDREDDRARQQVRGRAAAHVELQIVDRIAAVSAARERPQCVAQLDAAMQPLSQCSGQLLQPALKRRDRLTCDCRPTDAGKEGLGRRQR
jgi:hypothetical protein